VWSLGTFIIGYSPFLLFEIRHGFVNTTGAWRFIWQQKTESRGGVGSVISTILDVSVRLFWRLAIVESAEATKLFLIGLGVYFWRQLKKAHIPVQQKKSLLVLCTWFAVGVFSFGLYRGVIYDYYFGSLFPIPFLTEGIIVISFFRKGWVGKGIALLVLLFLLISSVRHSPLVIQPNNQLGNTESIARFVYDRVGTAPYNFALIAGKNSDHAYRYFLELWGKKPVVIENPEADPRRETATKQLWVVCEEAVCQPLGHSLWEIAGFGRAEIKQQWNVGTVKVFELIQYSAEQKGSEENL
jgi:hypothetical protein